MVSKFVSKFANSEIVGILWQLLLTAEKTNDFFKKAHKEAYKKAAEDHIPQPSKILSIFNLGNALFSNNVQSVY